MRGRYLVKIRAHYRKIYGERPRGGLRLFQPEARDRLGERAADAEGATAVARPVPSSIFHGEARKGRRAFGGVIRSPGVFLRKRRSSSSLSMPITES